MVSKPAFRDGPPPVSGGETRKVNSTMEPSGMDTETSGPHGLIQTLKLRARTIRRDVHAVWLAARDPRTPWYAKALAFIVAAYALSPIDLIPDFIPVIGYLDDLIIVPVGILFVVRLIPSPLMEEFRATAQAAQHRPMSKGAACVVVSIWILCAALFLFWLAR